MSTAAFEEYFRFFPHRFFFRDENYRHLLRTIFVWIISSLCFWSLLTWHLKVAMHDFPFLIALVVHHGRSSSAMRASQHSVIWAALWWSITNAAIPSSLGFCFVGISRKCLTGESDQGSMRKVLCSCAVWAALEDKGVSRVKIGLNCFNGNLRTWACSWLLGNAE